VVIEEIGPSLAFATATATRNPRTHDGNQDGGDHDGGYHDGSDLPPAGEPATS
jgi:hypothetical protein